MASMPLSITTAATKGSGQRHAFDSAIEDVLQHIESQLPASVAANRRRYYAVKMFERDSDAASAIKLTDTAAQKIEALIAQCEADCDDDAESIITGERYAVIAHIIDECLHRAPAKMSTSEKIDRIVTNRWLGLPIFAAIMFGVYYLAISTFGTSMTDWVNDNLFGDGWDFFGAAMPSVPALFEGWLSAAGASDMVISLVCDGIVAGVGAVLGFIPQMFVLFVLLSFLEDCGYMARVAFVMDRIFRRFGLSGKSFIPMLVSTGCGVPGVLATKTIENEKDRRMTVMTTTFIPCGAKLPIIALLMGSIIGDSSTTAAWISPLFYFLGVFAVIASGLMLKKTKLFAGRPTPFVMELPAYHFPAILLSWSCQATTCRALAAGRCTCGSAASPLSRRPARSSLRPPSSFGSSPTLVATTAPLATCLPWRASPRSSWITPCLPCSATACCSPPIITTPKRRICSTSTT
jgi:ferrous iron transport protein B